MTPPTEAARRQANQTSVLALLRERGLDGATNKELSAAGGHRFSARIHELRKKGYEIKDEHISGGLWRYTLMPQLGLFR